MVKHPPRLQEPTIWTKARSDNEIVVHGSNKAYPELHPAKGLDDFHRTGRTYPMGKNGAPDQHGNQFIEDRHGPKYHNDVSQRSWLRGGEDGGLSRPTFDHMSKSHSGDLVHNPNPRRGEKCTASGQDMPASPFSAAHRKGAGEGF